MLRNYVVEVTGAQVRLICTNTQVRAYATPQRVARAEVEVELGTGSGSIRRFYPQCRSVIGSTAD